MDLRCEDWGDYAFLDSGEGARLERFGPHLIERPTPQAFWPRDPARQADWAAAQATFVRTGSGGGTWTGTRLPASFSLEGDDLRFTLKPTDFGHLGFFPEHLPHAQWVAGAVPGLAGSRRLLNLFGYTGALSLFAARAGAEVTHVDASRGTVRWARDNAEQNGITNIRWITDDVTKYLKREHRRGSRYQGIVLDPPSFGRGAQGQVFKLERDLPPLLALCTDLLADDAGLLLLTGHTPGVTASSLGNLLGGLAAERGGELSGGEMLLASPGGRNVLPSGSYARWSRT